MITSKIVKITKENQFDKGWTLFGPHNFKIDKNYSFKPAQINGIVTLITFATKINIILSEICLSSRIVKEIEWANKYLELNIIAKNKDIVDHYNNLSFSSVKIDEAIDFNYIGIESKTNKYYIISNELVEIDNTYDLIYFNNGKINDELDFHEVNSVIIIDQYLNKDYSLVIAEVKRNNIELSYVVDIMKFDKEIFDFAKKNKIELLVSDYIKDGIILITNDSKIYYLIKDKKGFYFKCPIDCVHSFIGKTYINYQFEDNICVENIQSNSYTCFNGILNKLDISDKKIIDIDVQLDLMSDYVTENFDSSITEHHNDYSHEAKVVEYNFKLIPPVFSDKYVESSMYGEVYNLQHKWKSIQKLNFNKIIKLYDEICDKDFGIIKMIEAFKCYTDTLNNMVSNCDYMGYYDKTNTMLISAIKYNEEYIDIFKEIFLALNETSTGTKFDKFDDEIEGYRQTIIEKQKTIDNGVDVLSNKRRVEILNKKINDLLALKRKFEDSNSGRTNKNLNDFVLKCEKILENKSHKDNTSKESIENIIKPKEESKMFKLELFINDYLYEIKEYIINAISILEKLTKVNILEEYKVYDYNSNCYIVISSLDEYDKTKEIRNKFGLKCLAKEVLQ